MDIVDIVDIVVKDFPVKEVKGGFYCGNNFYPRSEVTAEIEEKFHSQLKRLAQEYQNIRNIRDYIADNP